MEDGKKASPKEQQEQKQISSSSNLIKLTNFGKNSASENRVQHSLGKSKKSVEEQDLNWPLKGDSVLDARNSTNWRQGKLAPGTTKSQLPRVKKTLTSTEALKPSEPARGLPKDKLGKLAPISPHTTVN